jgi:D-3-phosphoglycerate dehydrogenase
MNWRSEQVATGTDVETIYREADIISSARTADFQNAKNVSASVNCPDEAGAILINSARGELVDETALAAVLRARPDFSAAIDVFGEEPYRGELTGLENCLVSAAYGFSNIATCRLRMELKRRRKSCVTSRGKHQRFLYPKKNLPSRLTDQA